MASTSAILLNLAVYFLAASGSPFLGVNYGRLGNDLPTPEAAADLLASHGITKVKLYDTDVEVLRAMSNRNMRLTVSTFNEAIWELALDESAAEKWLDSHLSPFINSIDTIQFGNELLTRGDPALAPKLVPAMENLHAVLIRRNASSTVKITTPHAMDVLDLRTSFPPSAAMFSNRTTVAATMVPLLKFLAATGSPFVIDSYPYFAYRDDHGKHIELAYATMDPAAKGVADPRTGLHYSNMLDAMVDTIYAAMAKLGYNGTIPVVVGETGWPSVGGELSIGAGMENARAFVGNLVNRVKSGNGTPLQPRVPVEVFLFALFNENLKPGSDAERNFGLFYPNMTQVYPVSFNT